jgi:hypothetical protein
MQGGGDNMQARKRAVAVALGVVAAAVAIAAALGHASTGGAAAAAAQYQYQGPPQDAVAGSGKATSEGITEQFIVSAHSGPSGEDPDGQISFMSPLLKVPVVKADVTCMIVAGSHAQVGGIFSEPVGYGDFTLKWIEVIIDDNGSTDTLNAFVFLDRPRPPGFSPCNFLAPTDFAVDPGNYTVSDGVEHGARHIR